MLNIHNSVVILSLFSLSCFVKIFSYVKWRWDSKFVLVILTSKKAFCPSCQYPRARASGFALTPVRWLMISPSSGCNGGYISISSQISVSNWALRSLTLLWRIVIKSLVLQFNSCVMFKNCRHGHLDGSPLISFPYCKFNLSQNSFLFCTKLYSSKGTAESQFDTPGSFASLIAWSSAGERNCSIAAALIFGFCSHFVFYSSLSVLT